MRKDGVNMSEEEGGIEIGKYINWALTIALIIAIVYAGYKGLINPCNCQATYDQVCKLNFSNLSFAIP